MMQQVANIPVVKKDKCISKIMALINCTFERRQSFAERAWLRIVTSPEGFTMNYRELRNYGGQKFTFAADNLIQVKHGILLGLWP